MIARERSGEGVGGKAFDFQALVLNMSQNQGIHQGFDTINQSNHKELPSGSVELTYRVVLQGVRMEPYVKFLSSIENEWPGARVSRLVKLDWSEQRNGWDATVELSIFNQ